VIQQGKKIVKSATISNIFLLQVFIISYLLHQAQHLDFEDWLIDYGWVHTHVWNSWVYSPIINVLVSNLLPMHFIFWYVLLDIMAVIWRPYFFTWGPKTIGPTPPKIFFEKNYWKSPWKHFILKSPYLDNMVSMPIYSRILKHFYFPLVDYGQCGLHHKTGKTEPSSRYCVFGWRTNSWRILKYFRTMIDRVQSMESFAAKTTGSGDIPLQNPYSKHYICSILPLK